MRYLSLLFLVTLTLSAQQTGFPGGALPATAEVPLSETKPEDLASIEGQVMNASTGAFLGKASLILMRADPPQNAMVPPTSYSTTTDGSGKYQIKDVEPGRYRLRVSRAGFVANEYGARASNRPGTIITLDRAKNMKDVVFRLMPHGIITGRILDEDGDPLPNVQIQLARTGYNQGRKQLNYQNNASTNDLGEYRMFGIGPGKYYLSATYRQMMVMPNAVDRSAQQDDDYVPTFYPGTLDPSAAVQIDVVPGGTVSGINLKLSKSRTVRLKGRVTQSLMPGRSPISLMLMPRRMDAMGAMMIMNRNRTVDAKGNFEMPGVTPGSYQLRATMNAGGKTYSGILPVDVGARNVENLNVVIGPGMVITGHLRIDGPSSESLANTQIRLAPREPGAIMYMAGISKLNDDGSFRIEDVAPDVYNLVLYGLPDGFYVKGIRFGETDALTGGIDVTGAVAPLQVIVSPNAGQISGTVQNPASRQQAPGATVVLIPQEKDRQALFSFYKMSTTDQTGKFSFKNLTPGEYRVFAWEDIEPGAYADPDFVKPVESKGEAVTIKEGVAAPVQVTLIPVEEAAPARQQ